MSDPTSIKNDAEQSQRQEDEDFRNWQVRVWCVECGGRREDDKPYKATCKCWCPECGERLDDKGRCTATDCAEGWIK